MSIEVRNIRKSFGSFVALDDVSLAFLPASWSHCWGRRDRERPRCCVLLPG